MGGGLAFGGGQALVERRPAPAELLESCPDRRRRQGACVVEVKIEQPLLLAVQLAELAAELLGRGPKLDLPRAHPRPMRLKLRVQQPGVVKDRNQRVPDEGLDPARAQR